MRMRIVDCATRQTHVSHSLHLLFFSARLDVHWRPQKHSKRKARGLDPGVAFRLHKELSKQTRTRDMQLELVDESDLTEWRVRWYYGDEACPTPTEKALAAQLKARGLECIELRVDVPSGYPAEPPKARCYFPRV